MKKKFLLVCLLVCFFTPVFSQSHINYKIEKPRCDYENKQCVLEKKIWQDKSLNISDSVVMKKLDNFGNDIFDEVTFQYLDDNKILIAEIRSNQSNITLSVYNKLSNSLQELYTIDGRNAIRLITFYDGYLYTLETLPGGVKSRPDFIRKRGLNSSSVIEEIELEEEPGSFLHPMEMSLVNDDIIAISRGSNNSGTEDMSSDTKVWFHSLKDGHIVGSFYGFFFNKKENGLYFARDNILKKIIINNGQVSVKEVGTFEEKNCRITNIKRLGDKFFISVERKKYDHNILFSSYYYYEHKSCLCRFENGKFIVEEECPFENFGLEIR